MVPKYENPDIVEKRKKEAEREAEFDELKTQNGQMLVALVEGGMI